MLKLKNNAICDPMFKNIARYVVSQFSQKSNLKKDSNWAMIGHPKSAHFLKVLEYCVCVAKLQEDENNNATTIS